MNNDDEDFLKRSTLRANGLFYELGELLAKFSDDHDMHECPQKTGGECNCDERLLAFHIVLAVHAGLLARGLEHIGALTHERAVRIAEIVVDAVNVEDPLKHAVAKILGIALPKPDVKDPNVQ
jgi:hypothetical protein